MALARAHVWNAGDLLKAIDLNGEFNNILLNPISLISPTTGAINFNSQANTNFRLQNVATTPTPASTGLVYYNTSLNAIQVDDGTNIRTINLASPSTAGTNSIQSPSAGRLINSATSGSGGTSPFPAVTLQIFNGNQIVVSSALQTIPPAGITALSSSCYLEGVANSNLLPSVTYYVYAFVATSGLGINFSVNGRGRDNNGTWVKNGDTTQSLIGLCFTATSSGRFVGTAARQQTASWFNPVRMHIYAPLTGIMTSSMAVLTELSSANSRLQWVSFDDDIPTVFSNANLQSVTVGVTLTQAIGIDSSSAQSGASGIYTVPSASFIQSVGANAITASLGEGFHFATALFSNQSATTNATVVSGQLTMSPLRS